MIRDNIEFFNVEEFENRPDGSVLFYRYPKKVCDSFGKDSNKFGRYVSRMTTGCELRFYLNDRVAVKLSAIEADGKVVVYFGDFRHSIVEIKKGIETDILLTLPTQLSILENVQSRYPNNLCRIVLCHDFCCAYHGVETYGSEIIPYSENKLIKWLAYGSSITQSAGASLYTNGYIYQTAKVLGVEAINKGMGGSCFSEKDTSDFLIGTENWDFATLELGINMMYFFSVEEFTKNVQYLVRNMASKHPDKKIFLITMYPYYGFYKEEKTKVNDFCNVLRSLSNEFENTVLIEGSDVLTDITSLTCDILHPSDDGHALMAYNLYNILKEQI